MVSPISKPNAVAPAVASVRLAILRPPSFSAYSARAGVAVKRAIVAAPPATKQRKGPQRARVFIRHHLAAFMPNESSHSAGHERRGIAVRHHHLPPQVDGGLPCRARARYSHR